MGSKWGVARSDVHGAFEMLFARHLLAKALESQLVDVQGKSVLTPYLAWRIWEGLHLEPL